MKKNLFKTSALAILLFFVFVSCNKNEVLDGVDKGKVSVQFKAVNTSTAKGVMSAMSFGAIEVSSFKMNIAEIEFDFADESTPHTTFSYTDDPKLRGPFEVDLIANGELQTQILLQNLDIPIEKYEEIEFDLEKSTTTTSPLYNQTVRFEGTINNTPFVFTTNKEFDFEIEFNTPFVPGDNSGVTINFHIKKFFDAVVASYDLTQLAVNSDGIIMITYNENDNQQNNYAFGKKIWNLLDDMFDCDDDDNDDD